MIHPYKFALVICVAAFSGCVSPSEKMDNAAQHYGLIKQKIEGKGFIHLLFTNQAGLQPIHNEPTLVFLDGDGTPWTHNGTRLALDPTPIHPLAFNLMLRTQQSAWFITRPCYNRMLDSTCNPSFWSDARYSEAVVDSLSAALIRYAEVKNISELILIGYSGGGVLATLLANRISMVVGIITIASNLDIEAWSKLHHYLPLYRSLNPVTDLPIISVPHLALVGDLDENVPPETLKEFLVNHPQTKVEHYLDFNHVCCWERDWKTILPAALDMIRNKRKPAQLPSDPASQNI